MASLLRRFLHRQEAEEAQVAGPPPWAAELAELVQKSARAQARLSLRLEDIERKLEGGFTRLGDALERDAGEAATADSLGWDELLDALDILDHAIASVTGSSGTAQAEIASGLESVRARLERFLEQGALVRHASPGGSPDGRLFRVVGRESRPDLPEGTVTRVVRAAVMQGERLVREGAVIVCGSPT